MTGKISEDPDRVVNGTEKFAAAVGGSNFGILASSIATYLASLAQTLTNKTINAANNTISGLTTAMFAANVVDIDSTFAADSDTRIPTQKAVKTATDALSSGLSGKADTSSLAAVATSGNYSDLSGTPTLGAMAAKDDVAIADIDATGTPSSSTYLRGDGSWQTPAGGGGGGGREILSADRTYYVRTDGSDSNDGLTDSSGGAFLTVQKAVDVVAALDTGIYDVTISVAAGTYTGSVALKDPVGSGTVTIVGAGSATVISTTSAHAISASGAVKYKLQSMKLQTTTSGRGIYTSNNSFVTLLGGIEFGACALYHIESNFGSTVIASDNYTISGGAPMHWFADNGARIIAAGITITLSGTPAFSSTAFAYAANGAYLRVNANTFSGSATGARFNVSNGALIFTGGGGANYIPGDSAGSGTNYGVSPYGLYV